MCGISGIINKYEKSVNQDEIQKINDLISHRGPDDEGFYFEKNFAFGHRRLSILDLSSDGHQPMHYLDKYTITYNGEVYNYLEIREELIKYGYKFSSQTDTEVILASYDKWGEECVNKFNGMWAFAIYDKEKEIIFCSRDRFGIKPFYYTEIDSKFIFGSEIKQLLEFYDERYVNKKILMDYLVIGIEEHTNETFFENIYKLEQSHNLIYNLKNDTYNIKKYYDIKKYNKIEKLSLQESIKLYKEKLIESIKLRLRSDVTIGSCLSGGLDSSAISSLSSQLLNNENSSNKFNAIHAQSLEKDGDESSYARQVSDFCNLNLVNIQPTIEEFVNNIEEVIYTQEEPFGSPSIFMQFFVMKKAKEIGCKVMLDGQGGDETLLGYEKYFPAYLLSLNFIELSKSIYYIKKRSKLSIKSLILYYLYFTKAKVRLSRLKGKVKFLKNEYIEMINSNLVHNISSKYKNISELQYNEIYKVQMPHLLKYEDKNSMRNSIEARLPFIDYRLLETAFSLNNSYKIYKGWTKYILRKSIENILPKEVVWRTNKLGFEAPNKSWLDSIEKEIHQSISNSKILNKIMDKKPIIKNLDNFLKWRLYNIAKWEEIYDVKIK